MQVSFCICTATLSYTFHAQFLENEETFEIPVEYNQERSFKAYVIHYGYIHHIIVDVNGTDITIERDEEGNYRALVDHQKVNDKKIDVELLKAIVGVLEAL